MKKNVCQRLCHYSISKVKGELRNYSRLNGEVFIQGRKDFPFAFQSSAGETIFHKLLIGDGLFLLLRFGLYIRCGEFPYLHALILPGRWYGECAESLPLLFKFRNRQCEIILPLLIFLFKVKYFHLGGNFEEGIRAHNFI